ncbi:hypothetical protein CN331_30055, partial [Bacillus cereus]|uniref:hypothetical protein n=1 Tax=Bacillus cereus TaxID=1396 RepID=UPI000BFAE7C1
GKELEGALNLFSLTNGNFSAQRSYVIEDPDKKIVGTIETMGNVKKISEGILDSSLIILGEYNGPVDIQSVSGYQIELTQKSPGRIEGAYKQNFLSEGKKYTIYASTEYIYTHKQKLPFNTLMSFQPSIIQKNHCIL